MIAFVRDRLLPTDYVGVLAWNRFSEFTTDHAETLEILERFKSGYREALRLDRQRYRGLVDRSLTESEQGSLEWSTLMAGARLTMDEMARTSIRSKQDSTGLYAGIEYLRHLQGEKYLIWLTEYGVGPVNYDFNIDLALAQAASDARVVLNVVRTGGMEVAGGGTAENQRSLGGFGAGVNPFPASA